jgi:hypothetical protein
MRDVQHGFADGADRAPLPVFLTVDTEAWPRRGTAWPNTGRGELARDILGATSRGEYGLRYQLSRFKEYGLRASYFVEALSIGVMGAMPIQEIIDTIQDHDQRVELHAHSEWLPYIPNSPCPDFEGQHFDQLPLEHQRRVIERSLEYFAQCGVDHVHAFRAGNFTANRDTLQALGTFGVKYDSSLNITYTRGGFGRLELTYPTAMRGICEVPVSWFVDGFRRRRPAHLAACSALELSEALLQAWQAEWPALVIVMHSFDLLSGARTAADDTMLLRFEELCRFLAAHPDKFRTVTFADVVPADVLRAWRCRRPLRSSIRHTLGRSREQIARRYRDLTGA